MSKKRNKSNVKEPVDPYLNSFVNYERYKYFPKKVDLNDFKNFLKWIGDPQNDLCPSVLIAGTNGKGSVAAILSSIMTQAGYRTGLYTSPHIFTYRERIKINEEAITRAEFKRHIKSIESYLDNPYQKKRRTFFEVLTTIAFLYFKDNKTDINIFEVGLGGRLDSTNVVNPVVSVLTSIGFDHTRTLGRTLPEIAQEKCGIVREKCTLVSSKQHKNAMKTIKRIAAKKEARLVTASDINLKPYLANDKGIYFSYQGEKYFTPLKGKFQLENVRTALAVLRIIENRSFPVSQEAIKQGFANCNWRGRFEIISRKPLIILDGAHNPNALRAITAALKEIYPKREITIVFSCLKSKNKKVMASILEKVSKKIIVTKIESERASDIIELKNVFSKVVFMRKNIREALILAKELAGKDSLILVAGSIYLVSEALYVFEGY